MENFFFDNIGRILVTLVIAILLIGLYVEVNERKHAREFMEQCMADGHKEYQCEALWRAGQPNVVPVPTIIYAR